jgi:type IV secretion system protein VirB4
VFRLDKGRGSKVTTLALGGRFVDMALEGTAMQPLRCLETALDRSWAYGWLTALVAEVDEARSRDPEVENALAEALATFQHTVPAELRTMTVFSATVQDAWLKQVLRPYTAEGDFGHIFDGVNEDDYAEPVVTFEIGPMLDQPTVIRPLASFLFHLADRRASPDRPMLAMFDEGHAYMAPPFDRPVLQRMREGRGRFMQIGCALSSPIMVAQG